MENIKLNCSGSNKWSRCTIAPLMELEVNNYNNNYKPSRDGILVHKLAEHKIKYLQGEVSKDSFDEYYTQEIEDMANRYVECLLQTAEEDVHSIYIEEPVDLSNYQYGMKGVIDGLVVNMDETRKIILVDIFDLKTGFIKIKAKDNTQLYLYALGIYNKILNTLATGYELSLRVHIIQPSIRYTNSVELSEKDLKEFEKFIIQTIKEIQENPQMYPGEHCNKYYCKARGICKGYAEYIQNKIGHIKDYKKLDRELTDKEISDIIDYAPEFNKWTDEVISTIKDKMVHENYKLPGYRIKITTKRSFIKDKVKVMQHLDSLGLDVSDYMTYNLASLSNVEKIMGKKNNELLNPVTEETMFRISLKKIEQQGE